MIKSKRMLPEKLTDMMKNQSLTLKAVLENNGIRISIKSANDPMYSWSEKKLEISHLSHHCNQLIETLNKSRREEYSSEISKDLKSMGYLMADDLLPVDFKDILRKTHAESLILDLDEKLVHIPWEHICIDDELLCQKFSMGRFIETRQKKINFETREIKTPYHMWVLVNPQFDLENADSEGDSICRLMDQTNYRYKKEIIKASLNTDIHIDTFKSQIRHYDFIHFAGHGLYQNEQPDSCGLILSHGTVSTSDIKAMEGSGAMPLLIFSNACQSARTGEMNHMPFGLAHSFIRSGVRHYIGTFWKIFDAPGSQFATMFYQNLLSGHSIGKALKLTRIHFCEKYNPDMWASYVLYGNPDTCYFSEKVIRDPVKIEKESVSFFEKSRGNIKNESSGVSQPDSSISGDITQKGFYYKYPFIIIICAFIFLSIYHLAGIFRNTPEMSIERLKVLKAAEKNRQTRIAQLLEKIKKQKDTHDVSLMKSSQDHWTSMPLTLSIFFDPDARFENRGLEKKLTLMIGQYLKTHTRTILLNRMNREIVLEELFQGSSELIDPQNRLTPCLYPSRIVLFLEIYLNKYKYISLSLIDTQTEKCIFNHWQQLNDNTLPIHVLKELKTLLRDKYPLRGMISEVKGNQIKLNIGFDQGVRVGQVFSIKDHSCQLSILEVYQSESISNFTQTECSLQSEKQVFLSENDKN